MSENFANTISVLYPDISKLIGYNKSNKKEPFYLLDDVKFIINKSGEAKRYKIPKSFAFDGCTFKLKLLWLIIGCPHTPEFLTACLIHDYFCKDKSIIDRQTATEIFVYVLICEGVKLKKARYMGFWMDLYQKYIRGWK